MIHLHDVCKSYHTGTLIVDVLHNINLLIEKGEFVAIMGTSGSGKSTLMNLMGLLDHPTSGSLHFNGQDISLVSDYSKSKLRNAHVGFVFQQFHLLPRLNALENVELPLIYAGERKNERTRKAKVALDKVGLSDRIKHLPNELSGGQRQRVAIARAIVNSPDFLLADEPTGALDTRTGEQIMELLRQLNDDGNTVIVVTHDSEIAAYTDRVIVLKDGQITEDRRASICS
ncbi:ABC transporter ATP-binding protein [Paenibacillus mucilaginosus]|uniref:ABC transporter ATP-binding protein n=1 Tax=Paenibacillus mucilaginosus TaxID=61624 RepID=UPI00059FCF24|nr:ABC transporter ATP-binding protein [Paenibacillus mucilaginosus]MCG7215363.1 ABC transporter ATP-binding protein [Paenibacillus mucilaginosus]WDM27023.1 ABC transporter ATP-binding protein [Paenibacillus mucilaginosus]